MPKPERDRLGKIEDRLRSVELLLVAVIVLQGADALKLLGLL